MASLNNQIKYVNLGRSGLKVSQLSYGTWANTNAGDDQNQEKQNALVKRAFDLGINFFDTAETYGNGRAEKELGVALKALNVPRSDYVVSTKIYWTFVLNKNPGPNARGTSKKRLTDGVRKSLDRLQLDYIDILLCHRYDPTTPVIEVVQIMKKLIDAGTILYWGTSMWPAHRVMEAILLSDIVGCPRPIAEQCEYSMLGRQQIEKDYIDLFDDYGLGTYTYSPLAFGILTGKYNDGIPEGSRFHNNPGFHYILDGYFTGELKEKNLPKIKSLAEISKRLGCTQTQLAIAWAAYNNDVNSVILGATTIEQLEEDVAALDVIPKLTPEVLEEIEQILDNRPKTDFDTFTMKPFPPRR